jgi:hypothetical protein
LLESVHGRAVGLQSGVDGGRAGEGMILPGSESCENEVVMRIGGQPG